MGFTHYYMHTIHHSPARIAKALEPLIRHGEDAGVLAGPMGEGRPNYERPAFNGIGELSHESFNPCAHQPWNPPKRQSGFCKTARKPYDSYVVAALYRLKALYPTTFIVSTDGTLEEWERGAGDSCVNPRDLYREVYGEESPPPESVLSSFRTPPWLEPGMPTDTPAGG